MPRQDIALEAEGRARVYVLRRPQPYGRLRMVRAYESSRLVGRIGRGRYLCWETEPGRKLLSVIYERRPVDGGDIEGLLDLQCEAGEVYFCAVDMLPHEKGEPRLRLVSTEEGQALLADQKPARVK